MGATSHPKVFIAIGCHPKMAWRYHEGKMEERFLAAYDKCGAKAVAWGEIGLDFSNEFWGYDEAYQKTQLEVFERQIGLALARNLPLLLHIREAADEAFALMTRCIPKEW